MKINVVILAGGSGARLWPLSRNSHPKQFLKFNKKITMLQSTVMRLSNLSISNITTICNEDHRFFVAEQLNEIGKLSDIILEPVSRSTAPAIALASFISLKRDDDSSTLVLSADNDIKDIESFTVAIKDSIQFSESNNIVTYGITPNKPHTGYGYIKASDEIKKNIFHIESFEEKPDIKKAEYFFKQKNFFWNSGMFMFKPSIYLEELEKYNIEIYKACENATSSIKHENGFISIDKDCFLMSPSDSIDYSIMEKTSRSVVYRIDCGWSDLGSWSSIWDTSNKDESNNVSSGDVLFNNVSNSIVFSEDKLVALNDIKDLIVVNTKDAVLISSSKKSEDIKKIADKLKTNSRTEWEYPREVERPWGKYDSVDNGKNFQVKRITVKPGAKLSVQKHFHRSEHWVVVNGKAHVTIEDKTFALHKNESCFIPCEAIHALENKEDYNLELIEVQLGNYLGEDDIERFEDIYGRVKD